MGEVGSGRMLDLPDVVNGDKELGALLRQPKETIRSWRNKGVIPADCWKKAGGKVLFIGERVRKWFLG